MKLSILITLLNEELVLPQTHREISNQLEKMLDHELTDYELLYIDDGSNDKTFELIEGFAQEKTNGSNIFGLAEILVERAGSWRALNMQVEMRLWSWMGIFNIRRI